MHKSEESPEAKVATSEAKPKGPKKPKPETVLRRALGTIRRGIREFREAKTTHGRYASPAMGDELEEFGDELHKMANETRGSSPGGAAQ